MAIDPERRIARCRGGVHVGQVVPVEAEARVDLQLAPLEAQPGEIKADEAGGTGDKKAGGSGQGGSVGVFPNNSRRSELPFLVEISYVEAFSGLRGTTILSYAAFPPSRWRKPG